MALQLYNTLTRKKEEFVPLNPPNVSFYSCGPTVYNYAHIGNLRTYIFNDFLKRVLQYNGYKVKHVINITDVGHLTGDTDSGEDKMQKGAEREGKTVWQIADFYTKAFMQDIKRLNIEDPDVWPKATEHIDDMIAVIRTLDEKGYTYEAGGNIYYDTSKFPNYAELGKLNLENLKSGARTEVDANKKNPTDFVLWFTLQGSKFGEQHAMKWNSPWGVGYPGWHIECCAMSAKYLGEQFDIHTGGIDHIPIHHTNEIAEAEGAFGRHPWVKYWLHGNFLVLDKGKMAKSGDGFITLQTLVDKGYDPLAYKYFCLGANYQSELRFSWDAMDNAQKSFNKFKAKIIELKRKFVDGDTNVSDYKDKFKNAINDNLNIPVALATAWEVLNNNSLSSMARIEALLDFDSVLGLGIADMKEETVEMTDAMKDALQKREEARKVKDWATADLIRKEFQDAGFDIVDSPEGPTLKKL